MSTSPRASLCSHPTISRRQQTLHSKPYPPPCHHWMTPSWDSHGAASGTLGGQGGLCSSPGLIIISYQELALMEVWGSWPLKGTFQLPTLTQPVALLHLTSLSPSLGLSGAQDDPLLLIVVAPPHRGTLWPLLHHSAVPFCLMAIVLHLVCPSDQPCVSPTGPASPVFTFVLPGVSDPGRLLSHSNDQSISIPFGQALASVTLTLPHLVLFLPCF